MNEQTKEWIERTGLAVERLGASRTLGRLFGLLLVAECPLSLDDMAEQLRVSKASISTNARLCEQLGMVRRISLPGDRRDYYEMRPGSFERMLAARMQVLQQMIDLADEGLAAVGPDSPAARSRLTEMRDFYQWTGMEMAAILAQWQKQKRQRLAGTEQERTR